MSFSLSGTPAGIGEEGRWCQWVLVLGGAGPAKPALTQDSLSHCCWGKGSVRLNEVPCPNTHAHTHTHTDKHTETHVHTCVHMHAHMHTHVHTQTHMHTHSQLPLQAQALAAPSWAPVMDRKSCLAGARGAGQLRVCGSG